MPVTRDDRVFLEIQNHSSQPISSPSDLSCWLMLILEAPGVAPRNISSFCSGGTGLERPIIVPPGLQLHVPVNSPGSDPPQAARGALALKAYARVDAEDAVEVVAVGAPGTLPWEAESSIENAGYRAYAESPPLGVYWEWRERYKREASRPEEWVVWTEAFKLFSRLKKSEKRRREAVHRQGLASDASAETLAGLDGAFDSWASQLGGQSAWPEADDLAFELASHTWLEDAPEVQRRWLAWIETEHPGSSGAARAAALAHWMDHPNGAKTYLSE